MEIIYLYIFVDLSARCHERLGPYRELFGWKPVVEKRPLVRPMGETRQVGF